MGLEENKELKASLERAGESGKYMIGISYVDKEGRLQHSLHTNKFPRQDMLHAQKEIKQLVKAEVYQASARDKV